MNVSKACKKNSDFEIVKKTDSYGNVKGPPFFAIVICKSINLNSI